MIMPLMHVLNLICYLQIKGLMWVGNQNLLRYYPIHQNEE